MAQAAQEHYERRIDEAGDDPVKRDEARDERTAELIGNVQFEVIRLRQVSIETTAHLVRLNATLNEHLKGAAAGSHHAPVTQQQDPHTRKQRILDLFTTVSEMTRVISEEVRDLNAANDMTAKDNQLHKREQNANLQEIEDIRRKVDEVSADLHIRMTSMEKAAAQATVSEEAPDPPPT